MLTSEEFILSNWKKIWEYYINDVRHFENFLKINTQNDFNNLYNEVKLFYEEITIENSNYSHNYLVNIKVIDFFIRFLQNEQQIKFIVNCIVDERYLIYFFKELSSTTMSCWNEKLIDEYLSFWNWERLALNKSIHWNYYLIDRYRQHFDIHVFLTKRHSISLGTSTSEIKLFRETNNGKLSKLLQFLLNFDSDINKHQPKKFDINFLNELLYLLKYTNVNCFDVSYFYEINPKQIEQIYDIIKTDPNKTMIFFDMLCHSSKFQWDLEIFLKYSKHLFLSWIYHHSKTCIILDYNMLTQLKDKFQINSLFTTQFYLTAQELLSFENLFKGNDFWISLSRKHHLIYNYENDLLSNPNLIWNKNISCYDETSINDVVSANSLIKWDITKFNKYKNKIDFWIFLRYGNFDTEILFDNIDKINENRVVGTYFGRFSDWSDKHPIYRNGWENLFSNSNFKVDLKFLKLISQITYTEIGYDGNAKSGYSEYKADNKVIRLINSNNLSLTFDEYIENIELIKMTKIVRFDLNLYEMFFRDKMFSKKDIFSKIKIIKDLKLNKG